MSEINESLLRAWLKLSTSVVNDRVVSDLSYNEARICNILFREKVTNSQGHMTATDLCQETRMLKSQMNRTLGSMEAKGLICRERSEEDKRKVFVYMNPDHMGLYHDLHYKVMKLVDGIVAEIGEAKAQLITDLMNEISCAADRLLIQ